ncbi:hypothetical protein CANCADRAFT_32856 [Tortispora caseinolytica NRRL Y-17796]|uniref:Protein phosphatase n=1 Tax=Tortispora caseinolytica NRRL Y-17796 TaxID=767744 RepID=A0A1E4TD30_9ASCO|nr:hypothetical protein CANCADRAFT_32856 [Tortispora caseinolytica NRRL Y-17796]
MAPKRQPSGLKPELEALAKGYTNGDDAVYADEHILAVADGVGAWNTKGSGQPALWSRLLVGYGAEEVAKRRASGAGTGYGWMIEPLSRAYERTKQECARRGVRGTTTIAFGSLVYQQLHIAALGDARIWLLRPTQIEDEQGHEIATFAVVYSNHEQWHWFDCPRQLGTNSVDTIKEHCETAVVPVRKGDLVIVSSDGLSDNLWEPEIVEICTEGLQKGIQNTAELLLDRARAIAFDVYSISPYMERAQMEGLAYEGGKRDDISIALGLVE